MTANAQYVYKGAVDKYTVEFVMDPYSDGIVNAVYAYDRFDKPIRISGRQSDTGLLLIERSFESADTTTMHFPGGQVGADSLQGTWYNAKSGRTFPIRLARSFQLDEPGSQSYKDYALLQDAELDSMYLKVLVSRDAGQDPRVTGVRLYRKGDDRLLQELRMDGSFLVLGSITTGDFNFDGYKDFSVFEQGYAGPNTSSVYFLYDPGTRKYFRSEIGGVSLEFDPVRRRIIEVNQCCAGTQMQRIEYKLVKNKMVKTASHCFKWNEKSGQLEERPARECE